MQFKDELSLLTLQQPERGIHGTMLGSQIKGILHFFWKYAHFPTPPELKG